MSYRCGSQPMEVSLNQRTTAFHHSVVFMSESVPNISLMAYDTTTTNATLMVMLAKLIFGFGNKEVTWLKQDNITNITCENIDGGLRGTGICDGVSYTVEVFPIVSVNQPATRHGGLTVRFSVSSGNAFVRLGGGDILSLHSDLGSFLSDNTIHCLNGNMTWKDNVPIISSTQHPIILCGGNSVNWSASEGSAIGMAADGELELVLGFSTDAAEAAKIASFSPVAERQKVNDYYRTIFENWSLNTPWETLNETFRHARLNVEYSWVAPYGWTECLHHWSSMWHMEHTAAEEWAGNEKRSLSCLKEQFAGLLPTGAVPCLDAGGNRRREWGGDNQFFFRCVWHYLKMTNDLTFAKEVELGLETILQQTFREYDPCMTGILGWGTQLGNQEDFESTPGIGGASGFEGAEMLHIMSEVKNLLGKKEDAAYFAELSRLVCAKVRDKLWQKDVGRLAWYRDSQGEMRLEPAYHAITYPILYDQFNDYEKISSLDHLKHRMTGPDGEMYQSNHFGEHAYYSNPTWGMQCGSNMQPFASAAYAAVGQNNDAIRPLKFIADIVSGPYQRGSFPETANELQYAYFSPSAAVWSQGIIESIFGLKADRTRGIMTIAPCMPDAWNHASLTIPGIHIDFRREGNKQIYSCSFSTDENRTFLLRLPPYVSCGVKINGNDAKSHTEKHLGWFELSVSIGTSRAFTVEVDYTPLNYTLNYPKCLADGSAFDITAKNAEILSISDPANLLAGSAQTKASSLSLTLRSDLLDPYEKFGWFGLINFARRSLILTLLSEGVEYTVPVHLVIVPPIVAEGHYDGNVLSVLLVNNTNSEITEPVRCLFYGEFLALPEKPLPCGRTTLSLSLTETQKKNIVLGKNTATLLYTGRTLSFDIESDFTGYEVFSIPLCKEMLVPAAYWNDTTGKLMMHRSHMFLSTPQYFMDGLFETQETINIMPGLPVILNKSGFLPLDSEKHRYVTVDLNGVRARKLYLLVSSFITQHNVFGKLFRIEAECAKDEEAYMRPIFIKDLCFPGDVDMGFSGRCIFGFPTYVEEEPRGERPALPVETETDDYASAMPPAYPQHYLWSRYHTTEVCDTVFNLIEIDLQKTRNLKELHIMVTAAETAGGIYAISALK